MAPCLFAVVLDHVLAATGDALAYALGKLFTWATARWPYQALGIGFFRRILTGL